MIPSLGYLRPLVAQQFDTIPLAVVNTGAIPIAPNVSVQKLVTTLVISNPVASGGSVFLGNSSGVTSTNGLEIPAGTMPAFMIDQGGRQLYELQYPLEMIKAGLGCAPPSMDALPFVVWNLQNMFLVSSVAGPVNVSAAIFFTMYF